MIHDRGDDFGGFLEDSKPGDGVRHWPGKTIIGGRAFDQRGERALTLQRRFLVPKRPDGAGGEG